MACAATSEWKRRAGRQTGRRWGWRWWNAQVEDGGSARVRVCARVYLELQVVTSRFMGKINVHLGKLNGKANRVRAGKFKYAITRFVAAVPPLFPVFLSGNFVGRTSQALWSRHFFWQKDFSSVQQIRFLEGSWNWIERIFYENRINHIGKE